MRRRSQLVVINFKICIIRNLDQKSKTHYRKKQSIPKERKTDQKKEKKRRVCFTQISLLFCLVVCRYGPFSQLSVYSFDCVRQKMHFTRGSCTRSCLCVCVCVYSKAHSLVLLVLIFYIYWDILTDGDYVRPSVHPSVQLVLFNLYLWGNQIPFRVFGYSHRWWAGRIIHSEVNQVSALGSKT